MKNKYFVPLLCTSLVFFLAFFIMVSRTSNPVLDNLVPLIVAGLSLYGIVLTIAGMKGVSDRWYLGIPHVAAIGIACIAITCRFFSLVHNTDYLSMSLAFLPLTSIGFFLAFPKPQRKITRLFTLFSGVISTYGIFLMFKIGCGLLHPLQTSWSVIDAYSAFFMIILLPIIGLCHIGVAFIGYNSQEG